MYLCCSSNFCPPISNGLFYCPTAYQLGTMYSEDFDNTFRQFYPALVQYADMLVKDRRAVEDLVGDVFLILLKRGKSSDMVRPYLYRTIHNACMDYLKKIRKIVPASEDKLLERPEVELKEEAVLQTFVIPLGLQRKRFSKLKF